MPCSSHTVKENLSAGLRLDRYVSEILNLLSRSQIKARSLKAVINGKDVKLSRVVKQGDILELCWDDSPPENIIPQDIPLEIVYEDERCVVVNKTQGMVVHPGAGNRQGTLANALYFRRLNKGGINTPDNIRPGIVHRLDKETSGIIIAAYDDKAQTFLCGQFKSRKAKKKYIAIVHGTPKELKGRIETLIARDQKDRRRFTVSNYGKNSITLYRVLKNWQNYSLLLLSPKTGRTHQLRVHLKHLGHPILGDSVYGYNDKNFPDATLMLHSKTLAVTLPGKTDESIFSSPAPERFLSVMEKLCKMGGKNG
jgi:23S rRNA pseudouridine1911/1915/1917 synthase